MLLRAFCAALLIFLPLGASAAYIQTFNTVELGVSPQYPEPGDSVTVTAVDYSPGAPTATYIWSVDGSIVLQGVGIKTLTLSAGGAGTSRLVSVLTVENGEPAGASQVVIRPADVDLVWEGKTTLPPFYIGRPLPNGGSTITVLAVPHILTGGADIPPSQLIYTWKVNDAPLGDQSGYGKSSITITPPSFSEAFTVSVHAANADGTGGADGIIAIQPHATDTVIYENAALLGVLFNKNLQGSFPFRGDEASFRAYPIFTGNLATLSFSWTLDGEAFDVDPAKPTDVTFRKTGDGSGVHPVTFSYQNPVNFLEHGASSFTLNF